MTQARHDFYSQKILEGNPDLNVENNFKTLLSIDWDGNEQLHFQFVSYIQSVDNYIFLEPTGEFILTIRGAYPLYRYNQTQAMIYGIDFSMDYEFNPFFDIQFKYAGVRGENLSENTTLINMPADQLKLNLNYRLKDGQKWGASQLSLKNSYTLKQWRVSEYQDFVAYMQNHVA